MNVKFGVCQNAKGLPQRGLLGIHIDWSINVSHNGFIEVRELSTITIERVVIEIFHDGKNF